MQSWVPLPPKWTIRESGWPWMIALAFACGPGYPGLTSWGKLSRPFGTDRDKAESGFVFSECAANRAHQKR